MRWKRRGRTGTGSNPAALRFSPALAAGDSLPAAGLPWFMTMFGRDSIFTSLQALPFTSELASTTLLALAERQGTRIDDFRDEDPGRILHEMRYGEMTAFEERPHSPYYGNADATVRGARLARHVWQDTAFADRLEKEAADLKRRFNRDFWVEDGEYFAVAIDCDGRKVDSLTSNIGHLLWSGIVDVSKARSIARHLLGPRLYSGWGVRTLAEGEARYNPIGYHVGTVWPFDNSFIAWGLRRYGFKDEAACIVAGIMEAAEVFQGRLPEAFGGYQRSTIRYPVQYPTACSPQAWSTGAPLLMLRAGLGLEPQGDNLIVDPALPLRVGHLQILDLPGRWKKMDAFGRGRIDTDRLMARALAGK